MPGGEGLDSRLLSLSTNLGVSREFIKSQFKAESKEVLALPVGERTTYLLGLGSEASFASTLAACRSFVHRNKSKLREELEVDARYLPENTRLAEAASNGLWLGMYDIALYKTTEKPSLAFQPKKAKIKFTHLNVDAALVTKGQTVAETQCRIMDLVNAPANKKTASILADWAKQSGKKNGFDVKVIQGKKECEKAGLHALLAINKGSVEDPAFIIMEYAPKSKKHLPTVGLVGKGVTFDTGGISIKPSANMHMMKSDMGGAAAVLGALETVSKLKLPIHLIGIIPATDNCVGSQATMPGDVVSSYLGKTIEIIDTDAEGRVILADGLGWMVKNYKTDVLIDLATLTGSVIQTLGYAAAGMFSNNDNLCQTLTTAADTVGERLWRLPMWDAYNDDLKSDVADLRNYSGKPVAGAISAAKFLESFTEKHPAYAHLDIAGVAFADGEYSSMRSATAYGVRLLTEFCERFGG